MEFPCKRIESILSSMNSFTNLNLMWIFIYENSLDFLGFEVICLSSMTNFVVFFTWDLFAQFFFWIRKIPFFFFFSVKNFPFGQTKQLTSECKIWFIRKLMRKHELNCCDSQLARSFFIFLFYQNGDASATMSSSLRLYLYLRSICECEFNSRTKSVKLVNVMFDIVVLLRCWLLSSYICLWYHLVAAINDVLV